MPVERSAGAIIFRKENKEIKYLLLHYPSSGKNSKSYWDFPKGHVEKGESETDTVKREVKEETGLESLKFVEGFKEWIKYFFRYKNRTVFKIVTFYLAETENKEVKISFEHTGYKWLFYKEALKQLSFKNAQEILRKANDFIVK